MDAGQGLGHHGGHAEVAGAEGGVLAAGALAVVLAAKDHALAELFDARHEVGVHPAEDVFANGRDVGAQGRDLGPGRQDVVGGDVVADLKGHGGLDGGRQRAKRRQRGDVGAALDGHARAVGRGRQEQVADARDLGRELGLLRGLAPGGRIGEGPAQGGHGRRLGADQIDLTVLGAGTAFEVAVKGAGRHAARGGRTAHADARAAGAFEQARAGVQQRINQTLGGQHLEHLLGARRDEQVGGRINALAGQDLGHGLEVGVGGVGARADADLIDLHAGQVGDADHAVGHVGRGGQGLQGGQVDLHHLVIGGVGIGGERRVVLGPAHGREKGLGDLVGREDRGGGPEFRAHVGDDGALGHGQGGHAGTGVFHDLAHAALDGELAEQVQDDVLARGPARKPAGQVDLDHLGHGDDVGFAGHGQGHGQAAGAHGHGAHAAGRGGVGVGTDQGLARLGEILQVQLMADAGAGRGEGDAVFGGHGAQVGVVVGVAETHLQGVVVHVADGELGAHPGQSDGLELEIGHGAGGVLGQRLVDAQRDFAARDHLAGNKVVLDDLLGHVEGHGGVLFVWGKREKFALHASPRRISQVARAVASVRARP